MSATKLGILQLEENMDDGIHRASLEEVLQGFYLNSAKEKEDLVFQIIPKLEKLNAAELFQV